MACHNFLIPEMKFLTKMWDRISFHGCFLLGSCREVQISSLVLWEPAGSPCSPLKHHFSTSVYMLISNCVKFVSWRWLPFFLQHFSPHFPLTSLLPSLPFLLLLGTRHFYFSADLCFVQKSHSQGTVRIASGYFGWAWTSYSKFPVLLIHCSFSSV